MTSPLRAFHLRNAVTYAGLVLGWTAVAAAMRGHAAMAGGLIGLAVLADTFDGRFARRFGDDDTGARIGAELDSLSDACSFGMAPVVCTAALAGPGDAWLPGWAAGCLYLVAALTRLAFFNVTRDVVRGFIGVPTPVAALVWSSALCVTARTDVLTAVLSGCAVAMIAPWRLPRPAGAALLAFALWPVVVVVGHLVGGK